MTARHGSHDPKASASRCIFTSDQSVPLTLLRLVEMTLNNAICVSAIAMRRPYYVAVIDQLMQALIVHSWR